MIIQDLALILLVTTIIVLLLRLFKQPPLIGYIISGVILGPSLLGITTNSELLEALSHLGIAFLLFLVGVHLDMRTIKKTGWIPVIAGIGQILITTIGGTIIIYLFGLSLLKSFIISLAFSFSSTILAVKLLADRKQLSSLAGRITIGILLVQDIVAVWVLMFISYLGVGGDFTLLIPLIALIKLLIIGLVCWGINVYILPSLLRSAAKNHEVLFLFSITWCFVFSVLFELIGFSLEIGALIAGFLLASTPYSYEISSKIKPLRDFFVTIFFIILGSTMNIASLGNYIFLGLVLSIYVLIGNSVIVYFIMNYLGYGKRVSFLTGLNIGQISEFSLIVLTLAMNKGYVDSSIISMATFVGLVTITLSTYLIENSEGIYKKYSKYLPAGKKVRRNHEEKLLIEQHDIILFGYKKMGEQILHSARKKNTLIIDHDPEIVLDLQKKGYHAIFGDAADVELYEEIPLEKSKIILCTINDFKINSLIIDLVRKRNNDAIIISTAQDPEDALELYERSADYVIMPHTAGGDHANFIIDLLTKDINAFLNKRTHHYKKLKERK